VEAPADALPGSTFSGNPLAVAAVEGTLAAMKELDMSARVQAIEEAARAALSPVESMGHALRGIGALWCVELGEHADPSAVQASIFAAGILVGLTGRTLRLLPAATVETSVLREACDNIVQACRAASRRAAPSHA
jgi:acetylornithine/succinyldiaminopimelate/putrescine aminotransferase